MSREATKWAYGQDILDLQLSASELAVLRAICWKINPKLKRTNPLSQKTIARLSQVTSPTTQDRAIAHLKELGLLVRIRANELPKTDDKTPVKSSAYVYAIPKLRQTPYISSRGF